MVRAIIDIGSNSIKMRIARISRGRVHVIRDETEVVRLGRGMSITGFLQQENMKVSCEAVSRMVRRALSLGAEILVVGTMALRTAQNADTFVKMVKDTSGQDVHILSGEEEAKYSWLGAIDGIDINGEAVMFDSGGGSTEFVLGTEKDMMRVVSVPVGAVNLSEKYFSVQDKSIKHSTCEQAIAYVRDMLTQHNIHDFRTANGYVIGVGGGAVTMASVKHACENFNPSLLHGSVLTRNDIVRQIRMYSSLTLSERENVIGLPASRADVILGSACIIFTALETLGAKSCIISINGLRHGLLIRDSIM